MVKPQNSQPEVCFHSHCRDERWTRLDSMYKGLESMTSTLRTQSTISTGNPSAGPINLIAPQVSDCLSQVGISWYLYLVSKLATPSIGI